MDGLTWRFWLWLCECYVSTLAKSCDRLKLVPLGATVPYGFAWPDRLLEFPPHSLTPRPTSFFIPSIFNGIIWYLLPAMLIIVNDIFAYLAGEDKV